MLGINTKSVPIDVAKNRRDSMPLKHMGGGNEGKGREDDFAFQIHCPDGEFQGDGAVGNGNAMFGTTVVGKFGFKLPQTRAVVGEPLVLEDCGKTFLQLGVIANVGAPDV